MPINFQSPLNSLGYGVVGVNLALALEELGAEPAIFPIGGVDIHKKHVESFHRMSARAQLFSPTAPSLRVYHQFDLAGSVGWGERWAFPIFELDRFKPVERHHLEAQDKLFVTSEWARQIVLDRTRMTRDRVVVAPLGVDRTIFNPDRKELHDPIRKAKGGETVFFTCGKWEYRKGHDAILTAFNDAFEPGDKVHLVMNCRNPCQSAKIQSHDQSERYNREWARAFLNSKMGDHITVIDQRLPEQADVAGWMAAADCGVFPSRAEGWGLESAEMLAMGRNVIITNFSAHTEYASADNALLVHVDSTEVAEDGHWFLPDRGDWGGEQPGEWASIGPEQIDQIVDHMRDVHRRKQDGADMFNRAAAESMAGFTWERTAKIIMGQINAD